MPAMNSLLLYLFMAISAKPAEMEAGLVQIESRSNYTIEFFKKPEDKTVARSIEMVYDTFSFSMKDRDETMTWFKPEAYWPDYMPLTLRCKSKVKDWMEVVINNETSEAVWIKNNQRVKYLTWMEYLGNMFAIERIDTSSNPIYSKPDTTSGKMAYAGKDFFAVKTIIGDWMEIYSPDYTDSSSSISIKISSGWIRWKSGNKLLINYYPTA
jgi:hypothetical protein